jgi:uncharacterized protein (DUF362 family)
MAASTVVRVRLKGITSADSGLNETRLRLGFEAGLKALLGTSSAADAVRTLFSASDRVGLKINTIAGRSLCTRPETALTLARLLAENGPDLRNIMIWDRSNRELKEAGYRLNLVDKGPKVLGTDTSGYGYDPEIVSHLNIGSRFSTIQSRSTTAVVSLALLKDHGTAGVTAGLKNYYGAIHNPNKYHDTGCDPYVAELFDTPLIKAKHRLTIIDGLLVQYHRGPSYHKRWAEPGDVLVFSRDAVAADVVGWTIIEEMRARRGLPTLKEDGREPTYLSTAEKMGLGAVRKENIRLVDVEA